MSFKMLQTYDYYMEIDKPLYLTLSLKLNACTLYTLFKILKTDLVI